MLGHATLSSSLVWIKRIGNEPHIFLWFHEFTPIHSLSLKEVNQANKYKLGRLLRNGPKIILMKES